MSVVIMDGRIRVYSATAIANIQSPTVAEANAGTALTDFITPDGLDIGMETGRVDVGNVGSTFTLNRAGRRVPTITLTMHHDSPTDTPYNLFVYRAVGFLLVRRGVDKATAWTIADKLEVYPWEAGEANHVKPAPDTAWDFMTELMVTNDPATRAVMV